MVRRKLVEFSSLVCLMIISVCTANAVAAFSTAPPFTAAQLYTTAGTFTICGGLDLDDGKLYFAQSTEIKSLDLSDNTTQIVGTLPSNVDTPLVVRSNAATYAAYGASFNFPYPYHMGYIDANGIYTNQLDEDGIFDCAVNSSGDCYIVASPGAAGSKIFKYNWTNGTVTQIADIGGYQGGIAFDCEDNLYYADQGQGEMVGGEWVVIRPAAILKFTAAQVACGDLVADDGEPVLDITAGFIGFDAYDNFYATTGWGARLAKYDLASQSLVEDIAYGGIGKFVIEQNYLYLIDVDWVLYASTIQQIELPQPSPLTLLALSIKNAIDSKNEAIRTINATLVEELEFINTLDSLLETGEFEGLRRKDILKVRREILSALLRQRLAKRALSTSIDKLENASVILTGESQQE